MNHYYDTPGNRGIVRSVEFSVVCGGCFVVRFVDEETLTEAKARLEEAGWSNHYPRRLGKLTGDLEANTTWRCPKCRNKGEDE